MGTHQAAATAAPPASGAAVGRRPGLPRRRPVRPAERHRLVAAAAAVRHVRHDLLAAAAGLEAGRRVGPCACGTAGRTERRRPARAPRGDRRQHRPACGERGEATGPNPTDRGKSGSKQHLLTDAGGTPLACVVTAANVADGLCSCRRWTSSPSFGAAAAGPGPGRCSSPPTRPTTPPRAWKNCTVAASTRCCHDAARATARHPPVVPTTRLSRHLLAKAQVSCVTRC